jgi:hypothetical protein
MTESVSLVVLLLGKFPKTETALQYNTGHLLLLRGGIEQSLSCTAAILWSSVLPIWILIIPDSSIRALENTNRYT